MDLEPDFRYSVPAKATGWEVQMDWLEGNFGQIGDGWDYYRSHFWFRTEKDKLVFILMFT